MADLLVGRTLQSLINGVSQQPAHVRLPSQGEEQINCLSEVVAGISRRPPAEYSAELTTDAVPTGGYFTHLYDRDGTEQYVILISDQDIRVFDFAGTEATVSKPDGVGYLDFDTGAITADQAFSAITVADTTFIVNKTVTCAMSGVSSAARPFDFLLWAKAGAATGTASLDIGGTVVTWAISNTSQGTTINNAIIALAGAGLSGSWTFTRIAGAGTSNSSILYAVQTAGTPPAYVNYTDSNGNTGMDLIHKKVQRFSDLPSEAEDGFIVEIVGTGGDTEDNYWVKYDEAEHAWVETVQPGLDDAFDATTMPHRLVRTSISPLQFTFAEIPWDDRLKGDLASAPEPSFIGAEIRDIIYHKNRLGFLAEESIVLSEAGEYFNFWPTTATTLADSDPLDLNGASNRVTFLDWAVPFDQNVTMFSAFGQVQQELQGIDGALTPRDASVVERANYASSKRARPVALNRSIYFLVDRATASGVFEYSIGNNERGRADEVTAHIPSYIPGNLTYLVGTMNEQMVVASGASTAPNTMYVYRFHILGDDKVQSSWSKWTLDAGDTIYGMQFVGSSLYVVVHRDDPGLHLLKLDFRALTDGDLDYRIYLDGLAELTGVYSSGTGLTTWTLPYTFPTGATGKIVLSATGWGNDMGKTIVATFTGGSTSVTAEGDYSAYACHLGYTFTSEYTFSPAVVEQQQNRAAAALARTQLRTWWVAYQNTGYLLFTIDRRDDANATVYTEEFSAREISGISALIGPVVLKDGEVAVSAQGDARHVRIKVSNGDSYLPFTLTSAEWEGYFSQRSRQV